MITANVTETPFQKAAGLPEARHSDRLSHSHERQLWSGRGLHELLLLQRVRRHVLFDQRALVKRIPSRCSSLVPARKKRRLGRRQVMGSMVDAERLNGEGFRIGCASGA
jgi:hypothetical protein